MLVRLSSSFYSRTTEYCQANEDLFHLKINLGAVLQTECPDSTTRVGGVLEGEMKGEGNQAMTATDGIAIKM
jgi:hypothetical protein